MGLLELITKKRSKYEITSSKYFSDNLRVDDSSLLREFVSDFVTTMKIPHTIIAVGSTVFPQEYWDKRNKIHQGNAEKRREPEPPPATYNDIDLLVVPKEVTKLNILEGEVQATLSNLGLEFRAHKDTKRGVGYHRQLDTTYAPYLHIDYGLHSISTSLPNDTIVDLILGREDIVNKTASQKIAEERRDNGAFSILHQE